MHLLYVDEAGQTGKKLKGPDQPVFVMAGVLVSDEKWRKTRDRVGEILVSRFGGPLPEAFELHAHQLLGPEGEGPFAGWDRNARCGLALALLSLLEERGHQVLLQTVVKEKMAAATSPTKDLGFDWKYPWQLSFATILTMFEEYLRGPNTGQSSSGLIIIDHEDRSLDFVRRYSDFRQKSKGWLEVKKVVEIGYSAASHANPMIQLTDLVAFVMKKHVEASLGVDWSDEAIRFFAKCREAVWSRVQLKSLKFNKLAVPASLVDYLKQVRK